MGAVSRAWLQAALAAAWITGGRGSRLLPIFFMHGLNGDHTWFDNMQSWIRSIDPQVVMYSFPLAEKSQSLENMWNQGSRLKEMIREQVAAKPGVYKSGYALVCHSQGAILCRTALQRMDDHRVHTLIALAGPQAGAFGIPSGWQEYLPALRDEVYEIAFTAGFQDHLSVANYWNDPRPGRSLLGRPHDRYLEGNTFLPVLNNDPGRRSQGPGQVRNETTGERYRQNLLRLQRAVFTAGSADDQVYPYESGIFNFYGPGVQHIVPLEQTALWKDDWIGLRALNASKRLVRVKALGVCHDCWVQNRSIFERYILQHLPGHAETPMII